MYSMLAWQLPQKAGTSAGDFTVLKPASCGVGRGDVRVGRVAAVAIGAAEPFLPMNVAGKVFLGDKAILLIFIPHVAVAVALDAEALLGRGLRRDGFFLAPPGAGAAASSQHHHRQREFSPAWACRRSSSVEVMGEPGVDGIRQAPGGHDDEERHGQGRPAGSTAARPLRRAKVQERHQPAPPARRNQRTAPPALRLPAIR